MEGPDENRQRVELSGRYPETSSIKLGLAGLIAVYQTVVSPSGAGRCAFSPSCSAYAADALRTNNAVLAIMMTADRLMRDHPGVIGEGHYPLLPNGILYDPVRQNVGATE